jgi:hypothetical protein
MSGELLYIEVLDQPAEVIVVDAGVDDVIDVFVNGETPVNYGAISVSIQGELNGSIAADTETIVEMPYDAKISGWTLLEADGNTCTIVIDVLKSNFIDFPTFTSIAGTEKPTITAGVKAQDIALSTWLQNVTKGDLIKILVVSNTGAKNISLSLQLLKS